MQRSDLYVYDAIEIGAQYIGLRFDDLLLKAEKSLDKQNRFSIYLDAINLMVKLDKLLASHPNHKLENWVELARKFGNTEEEKDYYESNAKRLNTTWGGAINDYAARTWNGLIGSYYAQRWQLWLDAQKTNQKFDMLSWEENWIKSAYKNDTEPYQNPLQELKNLIELN